MSYQPPRPPALGSSPLQRLLLAPGQVAPGNINLNTRPTVHNLDGSISTVRTITVGTPTGFVNIPTVVGKRVVTNDQAITNYRQTGQHLGVFKDEQSALRAAQSLHEQQAREYLPTTNAVAKALASKPRPGKPLV